MPSLLGSEEHTSELQSPCNLVCRLFLDRKSTRLNSSHLVISYAVFCLKKKTDNKDRTGRVRPTEGRSGTASTARRGTQPYRRHRRLIVLVLEPRLEVLRGFFF